MGKKKKDEPEDSIQAVRKDDKRLNKAARREKTDDPIVDQLRKWGEDVDKG